eukprot:2283798-Ditylum_brightwellii.AAC.1
MQPQLMWVKQLLIQHPIGLCYHDVIEYSVDFGEVFNPLRPHNRATPKRTSVTWSKVDWEDFNLVVSQHLRDYECRNKQPTNPVQEVHYQANKIHYAYEYALKTLPQGCCPDPIPWCTEEFELLLEARNRAWDMALLSGFSRDWTIFREMTT